MGIIDTAKEAARLVQQLDNIDLVKVILNLQRECYELVFENRDLKERLIKAEQAVEMQGKLEYRQDCYWLGDGSEEAHGPICSTCWDAERIVMRMHRSYDAHVQCHKCKKIVRLPNDRFKRPSPSYPVIRH